MQYRAPIAGEAHEAPGCNQMLTDGCFTNVRDGLHPRIVIAIVDPKLIGASTELRFQVPIGANIKLQYDHARIFIDFQHRYINVDIFNEALRVAFDTGAPQFAGSFRLVRGHGVGES